MPNNRLQITLEILTQSANSALAATTASSKRMRDQFIATGADSDKAIKTLSADLTTLGSKKVPDQARQALQMLGHQAEVSAADLQALDNTAKTSQRQLGMFAEGGKEGRNALVELANSAGLNQDAISRMTNELDKAEKEMVKAESSVRQLSANTEAGGKSLDGMGDMAGKAFDHLKDAAGFATEPIVKVVSSLDDLGGRAAGMVSRGLDTIRDGFQELAPSGFYLDKVGKGMQFVAEKTANVSPVVARLADHFLHFSQVTGSAYPPMISLQASLGAGLVKVAQIATSAANAFQGMIDEFKSNPFVEKAIAAQRMETSLKSLIGSIGAAQDRIKELGKIADSTPFEMHSIAEADVQLRSFQTSAERFIPVAVTLASVTGRDVPDAALALGEALSGISTGVTMLQRSFRITRQDLKGAGADLDVTGAIVNKTVTNMEHLANAIEKVTHTKFGNVVAEQSKTLGGALSTMEDSFHRLETGIGQALAPLALEMVKLATAGLDMAKSYLPAFQEMVKYMIELYHVAAPAVELFLLFKDVAKIVVGVATAVTVLTKAVKLYAAYQAAAALEMGTFATASVALRVALSESVLSFQSGKLFLDKYVKGSVEAAVASAGLGNATASLGAKVAEAGGVLKFAGSSIASMGVRAIASAGGMAALAAATTLLVGAGVAAAMGVAKCNVEWDKAREAADGLSQSMSEVDRRGHANQEVLGKTADELEKMGATSEQVTAEVLALQQRLGDMKAEPIAKMGDAVNDMSTKWGRFNDKLDEYLDNIHGIEHVHVDNPFSPDAIKKTEEMLDALKGVRHELPALKEAHHETAEQIIHDASEATVAWTQFEKNKRFHVFNTVKEEADALDEIYDAHVKAKARLEALDAANQKTDRPGDQEDADRSAQIKKRLQEMSTAADQIKEQSIAATRSVLEAEWSYEQAHNERLVRSGKMTQEQLMAFREAQAADPKYKKLENEQRDAAEETATKKIEWAQKLEEIEAAQSEERVKSENIAIEKIKEQLSYGNDLIANKAALAAKTKQYYKDELEAFDETTEAQIDAAHSDAEKDEARTKRFEGRKALLEEERQGEKKAAQESRDATIGQIKDVQTLIESRSRYNAVLLESLNKKQERGFDVSSQIEDVKKIEQAQAESALKAQEQEQLLSEKAVNDANYAKQIKEQYENDLATLRLKYSDEAAEREIANIKRAQEKKLATIENDKAAQENRLAKIEEEEALGNKSLANSKSKVEIYKEELKTKEDELDVQKKIEEAGVDPAKKAQLETKFRLERERAEIESNKKIREEEINGIKIVQEKKLETISIEQLALSNKKAALEEEISLGMSGEGVRKRQVALIAEELKLKKQEIEAQEKIEEAEHQGSDLTNIRKKATEEITAATIAARKAIEDLNNTYKGGNTELDQQLKKIERIKQLLGQKDDKEETPADTDTFDTDKDALRLLLQRAQAQADALAKQQAAAQAAAAGITLANASGKDAGAAINPLVKATSDNVTALQANTAALLGKSEPGAAGGNGNSKASPQSSSGSSGSSSANSNNGPNNGPVTTPDLPGQEGWTEGQKAAQAAINANTTAPAPGQEGWSQGEINAYNANQKAADADPFHSAINKGERERGGVDSSHLDALGKIAILLEKQLQLGQQLANGGGGSDGNKYRALDRPLSGSGDSGGS